MHPSVEIPYLHLVAASNLVLLAIAVALGLTLGPIWIERLEGIPARRSRLALALLTLAVIAGGRAHFVFNYWALLRPNPASVLAIHKGGLHAGGAIVGLVLAVPLVQWALGVSWRRFADGLAPMAGIGIAIARVGCFLHGCCFGTVCSAPWCLAFPRDGLAYDLHGSLHLIGPQAAASLPVHPLQLYFAASGIALTVLALWMHRKPHREGEIALWALLLFGASSTALEFLRADLPGRVYWGPWPQLAWVAAGLTALAATALLLQRWRRATSEVASRRRDASARKFLQHAPNRSSEAAGDTAKPRLTALSS